MTWNPSPVASVIRYHASRTLTILLVVALLSAQTPAAPLLLGSAASGLSNDAIFWFRGSEWVESARLLFSTQRRGTQAKQESQEERDGRIAKVEIQSGKTIIDTDERLLLSAIAYDPERRASWWRDFSMAE